MDSDTFPRGLGKRLARESDKLKKVYRDKQRYLRQVAQEQRDAAAQRAARRDSDVSDDDDDDDDTDTGKLLDLLIVQRNIFVFSLFHAYLILAEVPYGYGHCCIRAMLSYITCRAAPV